jgi:hypothetical protein
MGFHNPGIQLFYVFKITKRLQCPENLADNYALFYIPLMPLTALVSLFANILTFSGIFHVM